MNTPVIGVSVSDDDGREENIVLTPRGGAKAKKLVVARLRLPE